MRGRSRSWVGLWLALAVGCAQKEPPPAAVQEIEKVDYSTFIERQFPNLSDKEFPQLARSREFIRKLERLAPRENAPGHWIDQIKGEKPPFVDVLPQLDKHTLYYNKSAVLAHWPKFKERYPETSVWLEKFGYKPSMALLGMPREDFGRYVERWMDAFVARMGRKSCTDYPPILALGDGLLYSDFLASRGGIDDKRNACQLLTKACWYTKVYISKNTAALDFGSAIAKEFFWPMLAPTNREYWKFPHAIVKNLIKDALVARKKNGYLDPEYIQLEKYILCSASMNCNEKKCYAMLFGDSYGAARDDIGFFLCQHAAHLDGWLDKPTLELMRGCLTDRFGKEQGDELFGEYLSTWPEGNATRFDGYRKEFIKKLAARRKSGADKASESKGGHK